MSNSIYTRISRQTQVHNGAFYRRTGKRIFELLIALPALILLSPLLAVLALLVRVKLGAPVLFRQRRPGLHGKPFEIVKFRTTTDAARLTAFGKSVISV